jgi:hypothetical protein
MGKSMHIYREKGTKQFSGLVGMINELPETRTMVEVGSANGESAMIFAQSDKIKKVICVDRWVYKAERYFDKLTAGNPKITKVKGGSPNAAKKFKNQSLDGVYIDATHRYLDCKRDIRTWLPKIKRGGWIAGHDYSMEFPGVVLAVAEELTGYEPNGLVHHPRVFDDTNWLVLNLSVSAKNKSVKMNLYDKVKNFLKSKIGPKKWALMKKVMPVGLIRRLKYIPSRIEAHVEYLFPLNSSDIVNDSEIRVIGLGRSGVHPIINWIGSNCKGNRALFINNPKVKENPFLGGLWGGTRVRGMFNRFYVNKDLEIKGKFRKKDCLIYNFENDLVEEVASPLFEENREKWVGKSAKQYDVLIMRDAFNYFASRVQHHINRSRTDYKDITLEENIPVLIKLWKNHAKEFLDITSVLRGKKVTINYNDWCKSKEYRMITAEKLDLNLGDKGIGRVTNIGGGSSFDGRKYDGKAGEMQTEERWKRLKDNEVYRSIFKDIELVDLSNRIFGKIPGTDVLL